MTLINLEKSENIKTTVNTEGMKQTSPLKAFPPSQKMQNFSNGEEAQYESLLTISRALFFNVR